MFGTTLKDIKVIHDCALVEDSGSLEKVIFAQEFRWDLATNIAFSSGSVCIADI